MSPGATPCTTAHYQSSHFSTPCTQGLYTAAISLDGCVQGVCTRVARVGERCAVVWLASEWHRVVCAVCVAHGTQSAPLFMHMVTISHCPA